MESPQEPLSPLYFNAHRMPLARRVPTLLSAVLPQVDSALHQMRPLTRARTPAAASQFELQVSAVISDALFTHLKTPERWLMVGLSDKALENRSRYKSPAVTGLFRPVLYAMERAELIELRRGTQGYFSNMPGTLTTFRASERLANMAGELDVALTDFGLMECQEVIVLKAAKTPSGSPGGLKGGASAWIDYPDSALADGYRAWVRSFNDQLARLDLTMVGEDGADTGVCLSDRRLKRVFNDGSFVAGGRLFGGCWQQMKKQERKYLRINGLSLVCLDYGQMGLRILYAEAGATVPPGRDPYDIPGLPSDRPAIKKFFGAMVNMRGRPKGFPDGLGACFPGMTAWRVAQAIEEHHAPIAHLFYSLGPAGASTIGMEMMHRESEVIIRALDTLMRDGTIALPIHDALLVAEGSEQQALTAMLDAFQQVTGQQGAVSIEQL